MAAILRIRNPETGEFEEIKALVGPEGPEGPQGPKGDPPPLSSNEPLALGVASPGTSTNASREDHIHPMPTAEDVGAVHLPSGEETPGEAPAINAGTFGGMTVSQFVDMIYPVGSIYMSANATSPASLFGGTWESIGGRFLLGADATYAAGSTGGEATHTLSSDEIPNTPVKAQYYANAASANQGSYWSGDNQFFHAVARKLTNTSFDSVVNGTATDKGGSVVYGMSVQGGNTAHNNMPPYLAVNMWQRTA